MFLMDSFLSFLMNILVYIDQLILLWINFQFGLDSIFYKTYFVYYYICMTYLIAFYLSVLSSMTPFGPVFIVPTNAIVPRANAANMIMPKPPPGFSFSPAGASGSYTIRVLSLSASTAVSLLIFMQSRYVV